ncbi:hypothetical protein CXB51_010503 [Gossypium anomalum]|uniref:apyrase n=1 Tax=Gossypium anomalum TaxID=47600 RepID=A0A8J5ZNC2_9ROSI|nr:hypothetical protein CXB51_010503 [Gossypium anomalum]
MNCLSASLDPNQERDFKKQKYHFTCVLWTIFFNFMEVFIQVLVNFMWVVLLQLKPGLSYYAKDPQAAANSLTSLLDKAESVVSLDLRSKTAVRVGATAGLRALGGEASDKILQSVRELLKSRSTLKSEANGVKILDGSQEGSYEWSCLRCFHGGAEANWRNLRGFSGVTINYLLGNLGRTYQDTVGIVNLGGGSVQMAYAISKNAASRAPSLPAGQDNYVNEMYLKGLKYYLYVHSYLHYGLLATRAEILKATEDSRNPCILEGFDGMFEFLWLQPTL